MIKVSKSEADSIIKAVNDALRQGHKPPEIDTVSRESKAITYAARQLGYHRSAINGRLGYIKKHYGMEPDWSLYYKNNTIDKEHDDPVHIRRIKDKLASAETRAKNAERQAISSASLREGIFNLVAEPLKPEGWRPAKVSNDHKPESIILTLSDLHMGEVIDFDAMGGRNSFNKTICGERLKRYFQSVVKMGTQHWSGPPPGIIYLVLMGDLISGEIHDELKTFNDLLSIPAVKELSKHIISGIELLLTEFKCDIRVLSVPGNHGRTTKKPEAKQFAVHSYDTLVGWLVESWFTSRGIKRVTFYAPISGDALVDICGWKFVFTHGDRIGSRGGAGFVGPAATAARGMQKVIQDYASEGEVVDYVIIGHFHSPVELEQGFVNGCLSGPSEYSRSGRMRSHPACQWMLSVHPDYGIARRWKINVGSPEEGSIYRSRMPELASSPTSRTATRKRQRS